MARTTATATPIKSTLHNSVIRLHCSRKCNQCFCANRVTRIARSSTREDFPFTCKVEGCLAMVIGEDHALQALGPSAPFARTRNRYLCSETRFGTSKLHFKHIISTDSRPRLLNKVCMWKLIMYGSYKQQHKHGVCKNTILEKLQYKILKQV